MQLLSPIEQVTNNEQTFPNSSFRHDTNHFNQLCGDVGWPAEPCFWLIRESCASSFLHLQSFQHDDQKLESLGHIHIVSLHCVISALPCLHTNTVKQNTLTSTCIPTSYSALCSCACARVRVLTDQARLIFAHPCCSPLVHSGNSILRLLEHATTETQTFARDTKGKRARDLCLKMWLKLTQAFLNYFCCKWLFSYILPPLLQQIVPLRSLLFTWGLIACRGKKFPHKDLTSQTYWSETTVLTCQHAFLCDGPLQLSNFWRSMHNSLWKLFLHDVCYYSLDSSKSVLPVFLGSTLGFDCISVNVCV